MRRSSASIARPGRTRPISGDVRLDVTARGRKSLALDLKNPEAVATVLRLCGQVDGLIEGYRPGVMERLGSDPTSVSLRIRDSSMDA